MFSLGKTVVFWAADSAVILLDLANTGRADNNALVMAIAAILALIRLAALLLLLLPAFWWLYRNLRRRDMRGILIVLIVASILFELWATPTRPADTDAGSAESAITQQTERTD